MPWLKQTTPATIYQSSVLPYVVREDGLHLCFDNIYQLDPPTYYDTYHIAFKISKKSIFRYSTNYCRLNDFPAIIPLEDIVELNENRIPPPKNEEIKNICLIQSDYSERISDKKFRRLQNRLEFYDASFLLTHGTIGPHSRSLNDATHTLYNESVNSWGRMGIQVADTLCETLERDFCWTYRVPELDIDFYGLKEGEMGELQEMLEFIGLRCEVLWR